VTAFVDYIAALKPPSSKGNYILKTVVSTTMGPACPLDLR
jgi:ribosomal protein L1